MKADSYIIDAVVLVRHTVSFEEPVSFEDAKKLFAADEYAEVHDEEPLELLEIKEVQQIGVGF